MAAKDLATDFDAPRGGGASDLIEGFNNLNILRQAGLMIGLAASVAIGFWVVLWTQGEDYRPLYGSLDRLDAAEVGQILDTNEIPYKVDINSGALMVPTDDVAKARLKLAEAGFSSDKSQGYELLDQEQPLGTSQFMEATRYRRGLEGELARTIASVHAVRSARVHLAIPKTSVFVRDGREPSASVFLELFPGAKLEPHQIKGITNLVASSIPEMKTENVSLVDQKGALISLGPEDEKLIVAAQHLDYTRKMENDMILRVRRLLAPIVGEDKFKTEISADVDFTEVEEAGESFNPDLPALRSEAVIEEEQLGAATPGGIPGALTNQPPASGVAPEQVAAVPGTAEGTPPVPANSRTQATRNYELDRTVSYTKHQKGKLRRLSVAVVVDDKVTVNEQGQPVRTPWTDQELERLSILVRDAVGFSAARGDSVNVLNERFVDLPVPAEFEHNWWENDAYKFWMKQGIGLLIILVLLVGFLRPVLKSLAATGLQSRADDEARELAALQAAGVDSFSSLSDETVTLTGGDALALPSPEESYEQQLNAVKGLVAEDAGRVAQVIKRWINEE